MSTNNTSSVRLSIFEVTKQILAETPGNAMHRTQLLQELVKRVPGGENMGENALLGPSYKDAKSGKDNRTFDFTSRIYSLKDAVSDTNLSGFIAQRVPGKQQKETMGALRLAKIVAGAQDEAADASQDDTPDTTPAE